MIGLSRKKAAAAVAAPAPVDTVAARRAAATVAADLIKAREALATREGELQAAVAAYDVALDVGRDAALAARDRLKEADVDRDIARRAVARLDAEHADALDAEHRAKCELIIIVADQACAEYEAAVREFLPEMGRIARGLVRLWAEAELANEAAVKVVRETSGEEAAQARRNVERFRNWPGRPRELQGPPIDRTLWTNASGVAVGDEFQERIVTQKDGSGVMTERGVRSVFRHRRTFRTETFLPAQDGISVEALVKALSIPGVTGLDRAAWEPLDVVDPHLALAKLDELERPSGRVEDRRDPETDENPVGLPVEVCPLPAGERVTQSLGSR